jgi:hypothetical protein
MLTRDELKHIAQIRLLLDKLERSIEGVDGDDWKVGDRIEINESCNIFKTGLEVEIESIDMYDPALSYLVIEGTNRGWIRKSEGRKVASGKVSD